MLFCIHGRVIQFGLDAGVRLHEPVFIRGVFAEQAGWMNAAETPSLCAIFRNGVHWPP